MTNRTDDDDAFDENGLLKDKATYHAKPMYLRDERTVMNDAVALHDARAREVMDDGLTRASHRPGWATDPNRASVASMRDERLAGLYEAIEHRDAEAWKYQAAEYADPTYARAIADAEQATDERERAYALKDAEDESAWWRSKQS